MFIASYHLRELYCIVVSPQGRFADGWTISLLFYLNRQPVMSNIAGEKSKLALNQYAEALLLLSGRLRLTSTISTLNTP